jgi:Predicted transcriptional regulators
MNRIKEVLKEQSMTLQELADLLHISRQALSLQIKGSANINTYERIASVLNVPMWQLFSSPSEVQRDIDIIECPHCHKRFKIVPID